MSKRLTLFNNDMLELDEFKLHKQQGVLSANTLLTFQIWEKVQ